MSHQEKTQQDTSSSFPKRQFKGIWIPAEIWLHPDLSITEKVMWAEIDSLSNREQGCTASNEYFEKFFQLKDRATRNAIAKLKKLGLVEFVAFDGRIRTLRTVPVRVAENCQSDQQKTATLPTPLYKDDNKVDNSNRGASPPANAPPPPPPRKREKVPPPEKKERERDIWLTDWEVQKLEAKVGKDRLPPILEEVSAWKQQRGIVGGDDYRLLLRWIKNLANQPEASKASSFPTRNPRELLRKIKDKYPNEEKWGIRYEEGAIIFTGGAVDTICKWNDNDFFDKIETPMKNRGMVLP